MVKSQKIAKIPEVLVSFLESINLIPPKQKLLNIFFLLFYAIFFQTKFDLRFIVLCFFERRNTKNVKTKNDFRFIVFPFLYEQTQKTEKRQMTSFLSFFHLYTKTHENIQTEIDFRSLAFRCKYDQSMNWI